MSLYDLVVIGSGPAGEGAAMQAAKAKKRVAVVESYDRVGGGCTHWGTIPSKALRHATQLLRRAAPPSAALQRGRAPQRAVPAAAAQRRRRRRAASPRCAGASTSATRCSCCTAAPASSGPQRVERRRAERRGRDADGRAFLIATGSRPYRPPEVDFAHPRIFDSDTILKLDRDPALDHHLRRRRDRLRVRVASSATSASR